MYTTLSYFVKFGGYVVQLAVQFVVHRGDHFVCKITLHVVALKRYNITAVLPDVRQDRDGVPPPPNRHVPHMSPPAVPGAVHQDLGGRHPAFCMAA